MALRRVLDIEILACDVINLLFDLLVLEVTAWWLLRVWNILISFWLLLGVWDIFIRFLRKFNELAICLLWFLRLLDFLECWLYLYLAWPLKDIVFWSIHIHIDGNRLSWHESFLSFWRFGLIDDLLLTLVSITFDHFNIQRYEIALWFFNRLWISLPMWCCGVGRIYILPCFRMRDIFGKDSHGSFGRLIAGASLRLVSDIFFIRANGRLFLDPRIKHFILILHRISREGHLEWWRLTFMTRIEISQIESIIILGISLKTAHHFL